MNECEPIRDLVPAYALGALDPDEVRSVERHLRTCADCQASLNEYRTIADGLLFAVPPQAPPARIRARLIANMASRNSKEGAAAAMPRRRAWPVWQVVSGLAIALLLVLNLATLNQLNAMQKQQAALVQRVRSDQVALALVAYPEGRSLSLNGNEQVAGTVVLNSELKSAVLFAWGLQPVDAAHTYQIWLIEPNGHRVSAGLFRPEPGQPMASAVMSSARPWSDFTGLGVTIEPAGGSPAPTTPRVIGTSF